MRDLRLISQMLVKSKFLFLTGAFTADFSAFFNALGHKMDHLFLGCDPDRNRGHTRDRDWIDL
jgi:hypothetical protein